MATPADPAFRQHLQALAEKYRASIPQRLAAIGAALDAIGASAAPAQLEALHESLHAVAGSAGSFGFSALGEEARRLEQLLRETMAGTAEFGKVAPQVRRYLDWANDDPTHPNISAHD
ncbi:Hpt domain-containing protein [Pseudoduganella armeniaca]|uniref:Hpt domain-containing protein n=1 Tax=Pseudoduganella armeniaca TaxID=2072590 RepID=A0A2R4CAW2_9BURK|nr:Hpt domain-containing protein [Pseudoduganella armeniaca]AVR96769.1 Hpt domain-containing protein [Pseudoduganella armeniaca]